ncbi:MAG: hypothetical protein WC714_28885 [Candidatus Obscuribacterales bacterium]|jgi:hypothetical protein
MDTHKELSASDIIVKRVRALERQNAALLDFVKQFLGNFKACEYCKNGRIEADVDCRICHGTGYHIDSVGILYVDLPQAARAALEAK